MLIICSFGVNCICSSVNKPGSRVIDRALLDGYQYHHCQGESAAPISRWNIAAKMWYLRKVLLPEEDDIWDRDDGNHLEKCVVRRWRLPDCRKPVGQLRRRGFVESELVGVRVKLSKFSSRPASSVEKGVSCGAVAPPWNRAPPRWPQVLFSS